MNVVSVSIPRSGHHFLESLLTFYFREEVHYCKRFENSKCCNTIPCAWTGGALGVQKSHDQDLDVEPDVPGTHYIAQYRHPAGHILSFAELVSETRPTLFADNDDEWAQWWGARRAAYFIGFSEKWLRDPARTSLAIPYERLTANTAEVFQQWCAVVQKPFDLAKFERAHEEVRNVRTPGGRNLMVAKTAGDPATLTTFKPRDMSRSKYLAPELVGEFQALVIERCPYLGYEPLPSYPVPKHNNLMHVVDLMERSEEAFQAGGDAMIEFARDLSHQTVNRYLKLEALRRLVKLKEFGEAKAGLDRLAATGFNPEAVQEMQADVKAREQRQQDKQAKRERRRAAV